MKFKIVPTEDIAAVGNYQYLSDNQITNTHE